MIFKFSFDVSRFIIVLGAFLPLTLSKIDEESEFGADLAHECLELNSLPEDGVPVIMLHGLTDTKETWDAIYEKIPLLTHRRVCIYDARNHGDSPWNDTFGIDVLADDLGSFMKSKKIQKAALVGHSMGGLTAMKFALTNPEKVERLFIEDISPVKIREILIWHINFFLKILKDSVSEIPVNANEEIAKKTVSDYILEKTKAPPPNHLFKKFPFVRRDGIWQWKSNFDAFVKSFAVPGSFFGKMEGQYNGMMFLIYGKNSEFKVNNAEEAIRKFFPNVELVGVEDADHFVHTKHAEFVTELTEFLNRNVKKSIPVRDFL